MSTKKLDEFTRGYVECALWASTDNTDGSDGEPLDENYTIEDIAPEALLSMIDDCVSFQEVEAVDLAEFCKEHTIGRAGHDFWLTRNRHGAGFWDEGEGDVGDRLTDAAHVYGSSDLYIGDDGRIYVT